MISYEYTVIPAPARAEKSRNAKTGVERFAVTLGAALNDMARDGWEYVRAETLPAEERSGLTGRSTVYHNLLVFRRALDADLRAEPVAAPIPESVPQPAAVMPEAAPSAVRAPFSEPMRATAKPQPSRAAEPPITAAPAPAPSGPRLGPANR